MEEIIFLSYIFARPSPCLCNFGRLATTLCMGFVVFFFPVTFADDALVPENLPEQQLKRT